MNDYQAICLSCGCNKGTGTRFCANCGGALQPYAQVCTNCGAASTFGASSVITAGTDEDVASGGMKFLAFLVPLVGVILGIMEYKTHPKKAKTLLTISIVTWVICSVIIGISYGVVLAAGF